jgi:hypothetical protein
VPWEPRFLTEGKTALDAVIASQTGAAREVKLLPNDLRPPMSHQFSAGVRQLVGEFLLEAAYNGVRSRNVPTFYWANENFTCPERQWAVAGCFVHNTIPGFANILLLEDNGKTWYDALTLKVDRSYRPSERISWGAGLAYTLAKRQTEGFNDDFSQFNAVDFPKRETNDERHRVVSHFVVDVPYFWGIQTSGLLTLGSGAPYDIADRFAAGFEPSGGELEKGSFIFRDAWAYRMVDLRLRKDFLAVRTNRIGVTLDAFNVFNYQNLGCYVGDPNRDVFGTAECTSSDARRFQLGAEINF